MYTYAYRESKNYRRWWHFGNRSINFEVNWRQQRSFILSFGTDAVEREVMFCLAIPFVAFLFLSFTLKRQCATRELSVRVFDGCIWWTLWEDPDEWRQGDRRYTWNVENWLKGKTIHTTKETGGGVINIPLNEGVYPATYTIVEMSWKRRRWPSKKVTQNYCFELGNGIPIPGKGESEWDLDDDAIMSISVRANSLHEAVAQVVESGLRDRYRYGGTEWKPDGK